MERRRGIPGIALIDIVFAIGAIALLLVLLLPQVSEFRPGAGDAGASSARACCVTATTANVNAHIAAPQIRD